MKEIEIEFTEQLINDNITNKTEKGSITPKVLGTDTLVLASNDIARVVNAIAEVDEEVQGKADGNHEHMASEIDYVEEGGSLNKVQNVIHALQVNLNGVSSDVDRLKSLPVIHNSRCLIANIYDDEVVFNGQIFGFNGMKTNEVSIPCNRGHVHPNLNTYWFEIMINPNEYVGQNVLYKLDLDYDMCLCCTTSGRCVPSYISGIVRGIEGGWLYEEVEAQINEIEPDVSSINVQYIYAMNGTEKQLMFNYTKGDSIILLLSKEDNSLYIINETGTPIIQQ